MIKYNKNIFALTFLTLFSGSILADTQYNIRFPASGIKETHQASSAPIAGVPNACQFRFEGMKNRAPLVGISNLSIQTSSGNLDFGNLVSTSISRTETSNAILTSNHFSFGESNPGHAVASVATQINALRSPYDVKHTNWEARTNGSSLQINLTSPVHAKSMTYQDKFHVITNVKFPYEIQVLDCSGNLLKTVTVENGASPADGQIGTVAL